MYNGRLNNTGVDFVKTNRTSENIGKWKEAQNENRDLFHLTMCRNMFWRTGRSTYSGTNICLFWGYTYRLHMKEYQLEKLSIDKQLIVAEGTEGLDCECDEDGDN